MKLDPNIIILTETKFSQGCVYLNDRLISLGYHVVFPKPKAPGYGVLFASKLHPRKTSFANNIDTDFRARVISVKLPYLAAELEIVAVYVPNKRDEKKKNFLQSLLKSLDNSPLTSNRIFCGDLNI
ncbi:MAG: hypothetical protein ACE5R6_19270, partial [Candidatus Heimdallarchaeota archaeon]